MKSSLRSRIDPFIVMDIMERASAVEKKGQTVVHMEVAPSPSGHVEHCPRSPRPAVLL